MATGSQTPDPLPDDELFRCDVERDGDTARVRPVGEMDLLSVPMVSASVAQLRESGCHHVVIDLRGLDFLDSTGVRFFLDCYAESRQDGYRVALIPGPPTVQRVFDLTGTTEHLPFVDP